MHSRDLRLFALLSVLVSVASAACSPKGLPEGFHPGHVQFTRNGKQVIRLEVAIASSDEQRAQGLMGVEELARDEGMVFLYEEPTTSPFYMKGTLIPLDIAFWDEDGKITEILTMVPCRSEPCPLYEPSTPFIGAIEVARGVMRAEGIRVGDTVRVVTDEQHDRR